MIKEMTITKEKIVQVQEVVPHLHHLLKEVQEKENLVVKDLKRRNHILEVVHHIGKIVHLIVIHLVKIVLVIDHVNIEVEAVVIQEIVEEMIEDIVEEVTPEVHQDVAQNMIHEDVPRVEVIHPNEIREETIVHLLYPQSLLGKSFVKRESRRKLINSPINFGMASSGLNGRQLCLAPQCKQSSRQ